MALAAPAGAEAEREPAQRAAAQRVAVIQRMTKPAVTDGKLAKIVNALFKSEPAGLCNDMAGFAVWVAGLLGPSSRRVNQICGYVVVEAESGAVAARLFEGHPHFTVFPANDVDIMPFMTGPE